MSIKLGSQTGSPSSSDSGLSDVTIYSDKMGAKLSSSPSGHLSLAHEVAGRSLVGDKASKMLVGDKDGKFNGKDPDDAPSTRAPLPETGTSSSKESAAGRPEPADSHEANRPPRCLSPYNQLSEERRREHPDLETTMAELPTWAQALLHEVRDVLKVHFPPKHAHGKTDGIIHDDRDVLKVHFPPEQAHSNAAGFTFGKKVF